CDGLTRRDFLRVGALTAGAVGLSLADLTQLQADGAGRSGDVNCILLFLVGGPSQLDTWDPKPNAPDNVRGPVRPIRTNVPGIDICEHFPRMARLADRYAIVRSVHHDAAPIHESGHQLMQTGHLFRGGLEHPHYGAVLSHLRGSRGGLPPFVVLPGPVGNTGVSINHGQTAGYLGAAHEPFFLCAEAAAPEFDLTDPDNPCGLDPARLSHSEALLDAVDNAHRVFDAGGSRWHDGTGGQAFDRVFAASAKKAFHLAGENEALRARYGLNTFGQSCLLARRLVEHGVGLVTVNMFDTVFNEVTWDCHADGGSLAVRLEDYKDTLCPMFDVAYTALLEDLKQRGLLDTTLVVAMGEFGRTPQLNPRGGRDHWPGVWSILFAGAGVRGGQVVGSSDKTGSEPKERPVQPAEVAATIYKGLGIDWATRLPGPEGRSMPLTQAEPIEELFRG
ncbi:MAG TPA: DUF1501 domain-containing protein, partial [Gemmataceae bacterium]|nr:DUF1501 domain-containing protein [Gemmataceae bacterium]